MVGWRLLDGLVAVFGVKLAFEEGFR